jgi:hypothetical protein
MRVEHIGISVPEPIDMGNWYADNLGFQIVHQGGTNTEGVSFVKDQAGDTVLELFKLSGVDALKPKELQPIALHIAIDVKNPYDEAMKLVENGAEFIGEAPRNDYIGEKYLVRDPWGFVIQLVNRARKLI